MLIRKALCIESANDNITIGRQLKSLLGLVFIFFTFIYDFFFINSFCIYLYFYFRLFATYTFIPKTSLKNKNLD